MPLKLRILQVNSSRSWGGMEMHLPLLCRGLGERGHQVFVVCHPEGRIFQELQKGSVPVFPLLMWGYINPVSVWRLAGLIHRKRIDIVHAHYSKDLWHLIPATRLSGKVPVILTKHLGSYILKRDPFHRWIYAHTAKIIANSEVIRHNVIRTCGVHPHRVTTVHYGLDLGRFDPTKIDRGEARRTLGVGDQTRLVGMVARFSPGKGHEDFLLAAKEVSRKLRNSLFLVVGEASLGEEEYERKIKDMALKLELGKRVIFAGFRQDIPQVMRALDLFVFPSHAEAFGLALIEAMAMETPVISTNCDGVLDIVEDGITGLQIPPGEPEKLAQAIIHLLDDEPKRRTLAQAGRKRIEERFSWEVMMNKIEAIYQEVLNGGETSEFDFA